MDLAPLPCLTVTHLPAGTGMAGVRQTVGHMRALVDQARTDPRIRQAASSIVYLQPERYDLAEVEALFFFVRDRVRYVRDVLDVETLSDPIRTLEGRVGDCDDQATLLAALLESVGYPTRFVVAGYSVPGHLEHVYLQAFAGGDWLDLDPTEYGGVGEAPLDPVTVYYEAR